MILLQPENKVWGKVIFSQACVIPSAMGVYPNMQWGVSASGSPTWADTPLEPEADTPSLGRQHTHTLNSPPPR